MNTLFYGDNLEVMRKFIKDESVDLCYIDPPFNSKRNYNQIYNNIGQEDTAQAQAFVDTWTWDDAAEKGLLEVQTNDGQRYSLQTVYLMNGLERTLGRGTLLAYIVSLAMRLNEIRRVLKPTGNFYLHSDPTASHYLKLVLDSVFCPIGGQYLSEIIWRRTNIHNDAVGFGRVHDVIFNYSRSSEYTINKIFQAHSEKYTKTHYRKTDAQKRLYRTDNVTAGGLSGGGYEYEWNGIVKIWRYPKNKMQQLHDEGRLYYTKSGSAELIRYLDEMKGVPVCDIWDDIPPINSQAKERLGYPTQKPEALLNRIINASSNEGDTVLDAYCGCGTTVAVAHRLNRKWIGIDITYQSISLILKRLEDTYGKEIIDGVELSGVPKDLKSARALALKKDDKTRKEFEKWSILTYSNNRAMINEKKGADKGIDGIAFARTTSDAPQEILFSVKSGKAQVSDVRDLRGTIEREKAAGGILIALNPPTSSMISEAKSAGFIENPLFPVPLEKIKIVTIEEILSGARLYLPLAMNVVKSAELNVKQSKQKKIFDDDDLS